MELWMDLLFGNAIGVLSVITVFTTIVVISYLMGMVLWRSHDHK